MIIITKQQKAKVKIEEADPTRSKNWLFLVTNPLKLYGFFLVCFHLGAANQWLSSTSQRSLQHWSSGCDIITTHMHITIKEAINLAKTHFTK